MSVVPPPYDGSAGFNPDNWAPDAGTGAVDEQYLAANYLQFPIAQGSETFGDVTISGTLTANDATFADVVNLNSDTIAAGNFTINNNTGATNSVLIQPPSTFNGSATFNNGIIISTGDLTFADDTVQSTAFIEANYAQLNTDNTFLSPYIQKFASGVTFGDDTTQTTAFIEANYAQLNTDNIFLAPYQNTFQQNNSTTATTAPIKITNTANSDNASFYIDPAPSVDLTIYSAQSSGGLTVRNPTASFTLNPVTITTGVVGARSLNPIDMDGNALYGLNNVYADTSTTTFVDSANSPMLQLTNGGHTSYENINMNTNDISNVNIVSFGGNNCSVSNQSDFNPNILAIANNALNNTSPQIYFQMHDNNDGVVSPMQITWNATNIWGSIGGIYSQVFSVTGSGVSIGAVPLRVNNIQANGTSSIGFNANINMNSFDVTNCGGNSTGTTQPVGDNSTKLATTAFVIANQPSTSNFAQLITSTPQTFTGQINFSAATKYNGNQVATVNQLPYTISSTISNYVLLNPTNITLNSGFSQISTYYPSTGQAIFLNYPITITITAYVAYNDPLCYLQFNVAPFPSFPPVSLSGQIATTNNSGGVNLAGYTWLQLGAIPLLQINMPYNVGIGTILTFTLASLGNITV